MTPFEPSINWIVRMVAEYDVYLLSIAWIAGVAYLFTFEEFVMLMLASIYIIVFYQSRDT